MFEREDWMRRTVFGLALGLVTLFSAALGGFTVIGFQVFFGDDSSLKKSAILSHINEETIIYTVDEQTRIGSFFEQGHRRYIPIDEVPAHLINAFIASEDKNFYDHVGVDPVAIFSAFMDGVARGRFVRGGSTITQQTVKNLLDKREHSFRRKFREWIFALQLERLYDKRQIMEFYLNQFHVALNGNGIGIAAQYYFNKDVRDLTLIEAAFIAGSVKGPSKYNPFIKYTPEARERARESAHGRKNYVLRRMYEQGWISKVQLEEIWDEPVPFEKGKFQSKEVALVSLIRSQVDKKEILEATGLNDISELNTAGLRVFTTIDLEMQRSAQLMMRRHLSRLATILRGYSPEDPEDFKQIRDLEANGFYYGKVLSVDKTKGKEMVRLDFGFPKGTISRDSLMRYAKQLDIAAPMGHQKRLKRLVDAIKPDDILFVEVRSYDRQANEAVVEMQKRPQVSGGLIVLDKGEVRSVVSGFDPYGYNRAIFATRQPGSVFKSLVYYAALQLGWNILDQLDNDRRVFPYQGQFYYPRPDHASPYHDVSMVWSGVKSENLGAVYLTYQLVEKLNFDQFKILMRNLGLMPEEGESERDYHYRVARKMGVQLENEGIREFELKNALADIEPDLVFRREGKLLRYLKRMWWGKGYESELQALYQLESEDYSDEEVNLRIELIKNNYQRHTALQASMEEDWGMLQEKVRTIGADGVVADPELSRRLARFRVLPSTGAMPSLGYVRVLDAEEPKQPPKRDLVIEPTNGRALNSLDVQAVWGESSFFSANAGIGAKDVLLEGFLPSGVLSRIQQRLDERYQAVLAVDEPYDLIRYYHHHDFRIAVGLNYLTNLAKSMGVFSKLEPIMSFPLGTNVVSVAEVAKIYQTFVEGKTYQFYKEGPPNQLGFIRRIEDRFGNVLWEPTKLEHQLVDPAFSVQIREILRKVVTHGTGRLARGELYVSVPGQSNQAKELRIRVPAYGKTGTTNDYTTASFAGFVPYPTVKNAPLNPKNSYILASYVGYDLNQKMQRGSYKVSGAYGALPVWTDLARSIIEEKKYEDFVDRYDLSVIAKEEWPLEFSESTDGIRVDLARGLILRKAEAEDKEVFPTTNIQETGELPYNEFALDAPVRSVVRMPSQKQLDLRSPYRRFLPYVPVPDPEQIEGLPVAAVTSDQVVVNPDAAAEIPGMSKSDMKQDNGQGAVQQDDSMFESSRKEASGRPVANPRSQQSDDRASSGVKPVTSGQADSLPSEGSSTESSEGFTEEELW